VEVIFFVTHSSDQCQPLDLLIFALLKRYFSASIFHLLENPQSNKVIRMLYAFTCATTPHLNIEALMRLWLIPHFDWVQGEVILRGDKEMAVKVSKAGDIQPDTSALLGPDARKRITLPGTQSPKRK
jgi:hypothetical protein